MRDGERELSTSFVHRPVREAHHSRSPCGRAWGRAVDAKLLARTCCTAPGTRAVSRHSEHRGRRTGRPGRTPRPGSVGVGGTQRFAAARHPAPDGRPAGRRTTWETTRCPTRHRGRQDTDRRTTGRTRLVRSSRNAPGSDQTSCGRMATRQSSPRSSDSSGRRCGKALGLGRPNRTTTPGWRTRRCRMVTHEGPLDTLRRGALRLFSGWHRDAARPGNDTRAPGRSPGRRGLRRAAGFSSPSRPSSPAPGRRHRRCPRRRHRPHRRDRRDRPSRRAGPPSRCAAAPSR